MQNRGRVWLLQTMVVVRTPGAPVERRLPGDSKLRPRTLPVSPAAHR